VVFYFSNAYHPNWKYDWSEIRPELKDTVLVLAYYGDITSSIVGPRAIKPAQYDRRNWFMKKATDKELLNLIDYPSGCVKASAYEALFRRNRIDYNKLLFMAINDTTSFFNYQNGCVGEMMTISEYLVEHVVDLKDAQGSFIELNLDTEERNELVEYYDITLDRKWEYYHKYYDN